MKKKVLFGIFTALMLTISIGVYAAAVVTTSCGVSVMTVDQGHFDTYGEWMDYMGDLNEAYCGKRGGSMGYEEV